MNRDLLATLLGLTVALIGALWAITEILRRAYSELASGLNIGRSL